VKESTARRARVLSYPDLARRLTEPPLNYRRPEDWTGWIPPHALETSACDHCQADPGKGGCRRPGHTARINNSVRRAALVDIAAEALRRAHTPPETGTGPPGINPEGPVTARP
jgi:hypothetical protein